MNQKFGPKTFLHVCKVTKFSIFGAQIDRSPNRLRPKESGAKTAWGPNCLGPKLPGAKTAWGPKGLGSKRPDDQN